MKDLNDRLVSKTNKIVQLEDQVRKCTSLINQICSHTFTLLRTKTSDFLKREETIKQRHEQQLMEVEDKLALEHKQC